MKFEQLLSLVGKEPLFESGLLLAGKVDVELVRQQLCRWAKSGHIVQLRRGIYTLAAPYRKTEPHPFVIANALQHSSYVSCQTALAFYGLIPEMTHATISVTGGRPERLSTPLGSFEYRHVSAHLLCGYHMTDLGNQQALVASAEKALLDLVYLQPDGDAPEYLAGLRLQNLERLKLDDLLRLTDELNVPKLKRAVKTILSLATEEAEEYETL